MGFCGAGACIGTGEFRISRRIGSRETGSRETGSRGIGSRAIGARAGSSTNVCCTLINPLPSIDYATRQRDDAHVERSDVCVLPAAGVVGEAMAALVLADALRVKFGGDSLDEALSNFRSYRAANG